MKFWLILLVSCLVSGQHKITGSVLDRDNTPVAGVSIYLDGTSIATVSDENGAFTLVSKDALNAVLVLSHVGYETVYISDAFSKPKYLVYLDVRTDELREVVIDANDGFKRKDKLKVFREQFLGKTDGGISCKILNEDDLVFRYDFAHNRLVTMASRPLRIENPYLGYELEFNLIESNIAFTRKTVNPSAAIVNQYSGTVVFKEMPGDKDLFFKRRQSAFYGSGMHLMRTLISGDWQKSFLTLYRNRQQVLPQDCFDVAYEDGFYTVKVKPVPVVPSDKPKSGILFHENVDQRKFLIVSYRDMENSTLTFNEIEFKLDASGNTGNSYDITYQGEMAKQRVGDMLPSDYMP